MSMPAAWVCWSKNIMEEKCTLKSKLTTINKRCLTQWSMLNAIVFLFCGDILWFCDIQKNLSIRIRIYFPLYAMYKIMYICQILLWWAKKRYHRSINISDIATNMVPVCSVHNASWNEPVHNLLSPVSTKLSYLSFPVTHTGNRLCG